METEHLSEETFKSKEFYNWAIIHRALILCSVAIYGAIQRKNKEKHLNLKLELQSKLDCRCLQNGGLCEECSSHRCASQENPCEKCQVWGRYFTEWHEIPTLGELYNNDFILMFPHLKYKKTPENYLKTCVNKQDISETLHILCKLDLFNLGRSDKERLERLNNTRNEVCHNSVCQEIQELSDGDKLIFFQRIDNVLKIQSLNNVYEEDEENELKQCAAWISAAKNRDFVYERRCQKEYDDIVAAVYSGIDENIEEIDKRLEKIDTEMKEIDQQPIWCGIGIICTFGIAFLVCFAYLMTPARPAPFHKTGCPDQHGLYLKYRTIANFKDHGEGNGREYFYTKVIEKLNNNQSVLAIEDAPGLGVSYSMEKLICAVDGVQTLIRNKLLAFHVCLLDEMNTQNPCNLIHNFVWMFSRQLPSYYSYVQAHLRSVNEQLTTCADDPYGTFTQLVSVPLLEIGEQPVQYIVIDNVDECGTCPRSLLRLLQDKTSDFPSWIKVIYASKNMSIVTSSFTHLARVFMLKDDPQHRHSLKRMIRRESSENLQEDVIDDVVRQVDGNYLCLHIDLPLRVSTASKNKPQFTQCLNEKFEKMFDQVFRGNMAKFRRIKPILEVMVATFNPLPIKIYMELAHVAEIAQDELGSVFREMERIIQERTEGFLSFVHVDMYTWLPSESKRLSPYFLNKSQGHKRLAEFLIANNHLDAVPVDDIARHVFLFDNQELKQKFRVHFGEKITAMFSTRWDKIMAGNFDSVASEDLVTLLLFRSADITVDELAFSAADAGNGNVLYTLLQFGAKSSYTSSMSLSPVRYRSRIHNATIPDVEWNMLQVAAAKGYTNVITTLMDHDKELVFHRNALGNAFHVALLYQQEASIRLMLDKDRRLSTRGMLMFAVKQRIFMAIDLLIEYGAPIDCVLCNNTLKWIDSDTFYLEHLDVYKFKFSQVMVSETEQAKLFSVVGDELWRLTCENPLDIAIYYKDFEIAKMLILKNRKLTQCYHYTGRLPIVSALKFQDKQTFSYLLDLEEPMLGQCKSFNFNKRQQLIKVVYQNTSEFVTADRTATNKRCLFGSPIESAINYYANDSDFESMFNHSVWAKGDFINQTKPSGSVSLFYALCVGTSFRGLYGIKGCKTLLKNKHSVTVLFQDTWCRIKPFPLRESQIQCLNAGSGTEGDVYVALKKAYRRNYSNETKVLTYNSGDERQFQSVPPTLTNCRSLLSWYSSGLAVRHHSYNTTWILDWRLEGMTLSDYPEYYVLCLQKLLVRGEIVYV